MFKKGPRLSSYSLARDLVWEVLWGQLKNIGGPDVKPARASGGLLNACEQRVQWDSEAVHHSLSHRVAALAKPWSSPEELKANGSSFSSPRGLQPPRSRPGWNYKQQVAGVERSGEIPVGQEREQNPASQSGNPGSTQVLTLNHSF